MAYYECLPTRLNPPWLRGPVSPRHMTGPNVTDEARKAYICQYARDGVVTAGRGDGSAVEERPKADAPLI